GTIDYSNVVLAVEAVKGTDANGTDYVLSGGSTINNVATATEYHQAINKGQFDQGLDGIRNGVVMYALNADGSVNKNIVNLMGTNAVAGTSFGVTVVASGGTTINNVATATEFHQAVNKGQLDEAIAQVYLENDGASVKYDYVNGGIDYKNITLRESVVLGTDSNGVTIVQSGGTNINNVATATQAHQAVNKGQMDSEFAKRDDLIAGTVQYDRNSDNSINFDKVTLAGKDAVIETNEIGVNVVTSGGTVIANVGNATQADHAINKGQFDDAIARIEAETEGAVKYDKNTDGTIDYSNITLAGETATVEKNSDGIDVVTSGGTTINNVATATEAHQAINKGQFDEALNKIEGESAGNVKYDKDAQGNLDYNNVTYAGDKAVVEKNDIGVEVVTSGGTTLNNVSTATEAHQAINKGQFDDGLARLEDGTVQYARNEDGTVNKNSVALGGDKAVIEKNANGINIVKSGGTVISNVAVATEADQAINKGQFDEGLHQVRDYADKGDINTLNSANTYTDNRVNSLWDAFQDESKDLRAGIAGAMAVGNLPQPSEAGYSMFSMGVATYKGQQAIAMGLSAITEDKRYIFKIGATTTSRNDTGGAASVGMQWK
ncbi:YadA-like family protein, partial [Acinetobacter sp. Q22-2]